MVCRVFWPGREVRDGWMVDDDGSRSLSASALDDARVTGADASADAIARAHAVHASAVNERERARARARAPAERA